MDKEIVVRDRGEGEGEQQEEEGQEGGRLAAADRAGRHAESYFSREAMRAFAALPSARPR